MKSKLLALCLIMSSCFGCTEQVESIDNTKFLFGVLYFDYASFGMYIDADGRVFSYDLHDCDQHDEHTPPINGTFEHNEIWTYFNHNRTLETQISTDDLETYTSIVDQISEGEISDPELWGIVPVDIYYFAYIYDAEIEAYETILIKRSGTYEQHNLEEGAEELFEWLKGLASEYDVLDI